MFNLKQNALEIKLLKTLDPTKIFNTKQTFIYRINLENKRVVISNFALNVNVVIINEEH